MLRRFRRTGFHLTPISPQIQRQCSSVTGSSSRPLGSSGNWTEDSRRLEVKKKKIKLAKKGKVNKDNLVSFVGLCNIQNGGRPQRPWDTLQNTSGIMEYFVT